MYDTDGILKFLLCCITMLDPFLRVSFTSLLSCDFEILQRFGLVKCV